MIKITAKFKEKDGAKGVEMNVNAEGKTEDVIEEALTIVNELPKSLKKVDGDLYREFTRKQLLHTLDNIFDTLGSDPDEDEEDEDDDESDEV